MGPWRPRDDVGHDRVELSYSYHVVRSVEFIHEKQNIFCDKSIKVDS